MACCVGLVKDQWLFPIKLGLCSCKPLGEFKSTQETLINPRNTMFDQNASCSSYANAKEPSCVKASYPKFAPSQTPDNKSKIQNPLHVQDLEGPLYRRNAW